MEAAHVSVAVRAFPNAGKLGKSLPTASLSVRVKRSPVGAPVHKLAPTWGKFTAVAWPGAVNPAAGDRAHLEHYRHGPVSWRAQDVLQEGHVARKDTTKVNNCRS
ncbi:hypothetical protein NDU88_010747 [Pleurodeles waltl]|uniref:Uncharacterized protein n=1 Tax=Pleurodeles waltl TaxID=8319 RepID=A0AAV7PWY1_PLEWA|nr:hypothetical protein NDU88_010747 [Pleurodeles waltl]